MHHHGIMVLHQPTERGEQVASDRRQTTLGVTRETGEKFNALKIRIAQDNGNQIPNVSVVISALVDLANAHYDELFDTPDGTK